MFASIFKKRIAIAVATLFLGTALPLTLVAAEVRTKISADETSSRTPRTARSIRIENYSDGDVQRYPVALLRGSTSGADAGTDAGTDAGANVKIVVENLSSARPTRISRATVRGGRFKILVELVPGLNRLTVAVGSARIDWSLVYRKSSNRNVVRLIYFTDSTGDAAFEIPAFWNGTDAPIFSNDFQNKMRTAALLWQTATAERLNDAGLGRRTFALEFDENDDVLVRVQRGKKTAAEYRALSEDALFREIYREIKDAPETNVFVRTFALVSFARRGSVEEKNGENGSENGLKLDGEKRNDAQNCDKNAPSNGRLALGGGAVAALDATTLFSWPDSLGDVEAFFSDSAPISEEFAIDSGFRRTRWALSASTLGSGLHELGHAFGLDHSSDPVDFMSRGFDRFNRIFTVVEPPSVAEPEAFFFSEESAATWRRESAEKLIRSFWIEE